MSGSSLVADRNNFIRVYIFIINEINQIAISADCAGVAFSRVESSRAIGSDRRHSIGDPSRLLALRCAVLLCVNYCAVQNVKAGVHTRIRRFTIALIELRKCSLSDIINVM